MYKIKNKLKLSVLILFVFSALIACGESSNDTEAEDTNEVTIAYDAIPPTLDPLMSTSTGTTDFATQIFEPLFTIDSEFNPQPMLADSYEISEDGKEVIIDLRENVEFHNGDEMTSEDVVASMERWLKESAVASTNLPDTSIEEIDDHKVKMVLDEPNHLILHTLSNPQQQAAIMPKDIVDSASSEGVEEYIGTGPYEVSEYEDSQSLHLSKFESYKNTEEESDGLAGKKEPKIDDVYIDIVDDETIRISGLQTGEYDIATRIPYDNVEEIENDDSLNSYAEPFGFQGVWFNKKEGPFEDIKLRKAVNAALDMDEIGTAAYTGEEYYDLSHSLVSEDQELWYSDAGSDQYNLNDMDKAKEYLEESDYDGEEVTFITTREYPEHYQASLVIQDKLEDLGVNVNLEEYDWPTVLESRDDSEKWDMLTNGSNFEPFPADSIYLHSDNGSTSGWSDNDKIDTLVEEIKDGEDDEEASELYSELQEETWDYVPFIPFGHHKPLNGLQDDIDGFEVNYSLVLWNLEKQ